MRTAAAASPTSYRCWPRRHAERLAEWTGLFTAATVDARLSHRRFAAIVASHSTGHPEFSALWRRRLQFALLRCRAAGQVVLVCRDNPIGPWVELFADRLDVPYLRLELPERVAGDCRSRRAIGEPNRAGWSPPSLRFKWRDRSEAGRHRLPELGELPLPDRVVAALADEVWAIEVKPDSKTATILLHWLEGGGHGRFGVASRSQVFCFGGAESLFSQSTCGKSIAAVPDPPCDSTCGSGEGGSARREDVCRTVRAHGPSANACWVPCLAAAAARTVATREGRYLIHCTRGRQGNLPGQSPAGYAAELLLCRGDVEPSPLETLVRILRSGQIAATSLLKREAAASVSFADVPLAELLARRTYQRHLRRWDWEPYGLAIRREALEEHFEAKPVQYLSPGAYHRLPADERWLFQPADADRRDWTAEREWRCRSDVRLSRLSFADAIIFAASPVEASMLQRFSRFAVMAVGPP